MVKIHSLGFSDISSYNGEELLKLNGEPYQALTSTLHHPHPFRLLFLLGTFPGNRAWPKPNLYTSSADLLSCAIKHSTYSRHTAADGPSYSLSLLIRIYVVFFKLLELSQKMYILVINIVTSEKMCV